MSSNTKPKIKIAHLYPQEMNLYGDTGNVLILKKRLEWRGFKTEIIQVGVGKPIPNDADIIFGGGGQDASQGKIEQDFVSKGAVLRQMAEDGKVMLLICGLYQLMGRKFVTYEGDEIHGLSILPIDTYGKKKRIIGNIVIDIPNLGRVIGYENHSGQTFLDDYNLALGKVIKGVGNNESSNTEGCRYNNVFATYLHGPLLAKSPELSDELIVQALKNKGYNEPLETLDDSLAERAAAIATSRPR